MRVFVTGAEGFVGRRLVARLAARGADVAATDRRDLDIRDAARVRERVAAARPDVVFHLAAVSFVPAAESDPAGTLRVNFLGTRHVLEAVRHEAPAARVVLVSSSTVYGPAAPGAPPFEESAPLRPANAYARSKAAADLLGAAHAARGLDVVRVRPWNHTGAGRPDSFVESSFARQLAEIEAGLRPPRLETGTLDAVRDFLHVDDVLDAYLALLDARASAGVYNVASGRGETIGAVLDTLLRESRARPEVVTSAARQRPPDASVGSAAKLAAATGWRPQRSLADALREVLDFWRDEIRSRGDHLGDRSSS